MCLCLFLEEVVWSKMKHFACLLYPLLSVEFKFVTRPLLPINDGLQQ